MQDKMMKMLEEIHSKIVGEFKPDEDTMDIGEQSVAEAGDTPDKWSVDKPDMKKQAAIAMLKKKMSKKME